MFASQKERYEFTFHWSKIFACSKTACRAFAFEYLKSSAELSNAVIEKYLLKNAQKLLVSKDLEALKNALAKEENAFVICTAVRLYCKTITQHKENFSDHENIQQCQRLAAMLARTATLFSENLFAFQGVPQTMRLVSSEESALPWQDSRQELFLTRNGQVLFSSSTPSCAWQENPLRRPQKTLLSPVVAKEILDEVSSIFAAGWNPDHEYDHGIWKLELTNTEGTVFCFSDSLYSSQKVLYHLSKLIRTALKKRMLFAFDGIIVPERAVSRLTLKYRQPSDSSDHEESLLSYETFVIDRTIGMASWRRTDSHLGNCSFHCTFPNSVNFVLDQLSYPEIFQQPTPVSSAFLEPHQNIPLYTLCVEYADGTLQLLQGHYDRAELPEYFPIIMQMITSLLSRSRTGSMLSSTQYQNARPRKGSLIYCSVVFEHTDKTYYYRAENSFFQVGDHVVVPTGGSNRETLAKIVKIEYFAPEDVPFPVEKTKCILRRYTGENL